MLQRKNDGHMLNSADFSPNDSLIYHDFSTAGSAKTGKVMIVTGSGTCLLTNYISLSHQHSLIFNNIH